MAQPMPALYLGHGAPPLLEDAAWMAELSTWADGLPRPTSILIVSAHWQTAPIAISATTRVPLVYDFYGFPQHYYEMTYDARARPRGEGPCAHARDGTGRRPADPGPRPRRVGRATRVSSSSAAAS